MLPREALMEAGGPGARRLKPPRPPAPDPRALGEAARILADADRPVILTSRTGRDPTAAQALVRLAELLGCPVVDHRDRLNFPPRHPLYAGDSLAPLRDADAILLLDVEVPWIPAQFTPAANATVLQIDIDCLKRTMPAWSYPIDLAMTADTAVALPLLEAEVLGLGDAARSGKWRERRGDVQRGLERLRRDWEERARSSDPVDMPDAMVSALNRALPADAVVIEDAVTNRGTVVRQVVREFDRYFSSGAPALGSVLGGALGAKLARPEAPVVAICGDGGFNFGVPTAAFFTAHRTGAPFLSVILNNGAYRASQNPVRALYPDGAAVARNDFPETELAPALDYVQLARACGGDGCVVSRPEEMAAAVDGCLDHLAQGRCAVIDVRLPGSQPAAP
jgi:acetolactate synthase-1/2/3 large subunit